MRRTRRQLRLAKRQSLRRTVVVMVRRNVASFAIQRRGRRSHARVRSDTIDRRLRNGSDGWKGEARRGSGGAARGGDDDKI